MTNLCFQLYVVLSGVVKLLGLHPSQGGNNSSAPLIRAAYTALPSVTQWLTQSSLLASVSTLYILPSLSYLAAVSSIRSAFI